MSNLLPLVRTAVSGNGFNMRRTPDGLIWLYNYINTEPWYSLYYQWKVVHTLLSLIVAGYWSGSCCRKRRLVECREKLSSVWDRQWWRGERTEGTHHTQRWRSTGIILMWSTTIKMDTSLERRARIQVKALTRGHHTLTQMSPSINLAVESKTSFWGLYDGIEIDDFIPSVTKLSNIDETS